MTYRGEVALANLKVEKLLPILAILNFQRLFVNKFDSESN